MNVLFVAHRYPPHTGGVETHVRELATRLVDRGHDVTAFAADAGSDVPSWSIDEGVRVRRFRSLSPGGAFYAAPQITRAVRRADADVVHAHNYHAFPLFFTALGAADERFVVTPHYHGASASGFRNALLSLYRPLGRWVVRRADEVIAVSDWERRRLRADFGVDATVVPNGIDRDRFADATPASRDRPYLLCVGRLEAYKGVQHAIRALPELPEYDLVVAGDGPYREQLEAIARNAGVRDRVSFEGYVDDDRLPSLYAGASVCVALSTFEAFGMTVQEALAAGTPCVVRETRALADWTDVAGVVGVESVEPASIAAAVREACDLSADRSAVDDWNAVVAAIEALYSTGESARS